MITHAIETLHTRRDTSHVHNNGKFFGKKIQNDTTYLKHYHLLILQSFTENVLNYLFSQLSSEESRDVQYNKDLINLFKNGD